MKRTYDVESLKRRKGTPIAFHESPPHSCSSLRLDISRRKFTLVEIFTGYFPSQIR